MVQTESTPKTLSENPNPEVVPVKKKTRKRRNLTAKFKLGILEKVDRCSAPGEKGSFLRREGIYASQVSKWRQLRDAGQLQSLAQKRGRKKDPGTVLRREIEQLRKKNEQLEKRLKKTEAIIDVQKKLCIVLGLDD